MCQKKKFYVLSCCSLVRFAVHEYTAALPWLCHIMCSPSSSDALMPFNAYIHKRSAAQAVMGTKVVKTFSQLNQDYSYRNFAVLPYDYVIVVNNMIVARGYFHKKLEDNVHIDQLRLPTPVILQCHLFFINECTYGPSVDLTLSSAFVIFK